MSIQFSGGERFQRGRGIGELLRLGKVLFKPVIESIGKAMRSNTGQAIGNALKNQARDTSKNLATDVLTGNNLREGVKREVPNIKNRAALGIQQLNKKQEIKFSESKRQSKEVQNSKSKSKRKTKVNKRVGKWVWFDKPRNE